MKQLPMFDAIEIPLTRGYAALVDPCDADLVQYSWHVFTTKTNRVIYAARSIYNNPQGPIGYLHRIILSRILSRELIAGEHCDHINGNGLDNRRCNLRMATNTDNRRNCQLRKDNKSGYKGVKQPQITVNGKLKHLGMFDTPELAAAAYNAAAVQHFGEFARLNDISAARTQSQEAQQ